MSHPAARVAETTLTLAEPGGLHLRAAARLVQAAARFASRISIHDSARPDSPEIDAKSLIGLLQSGVTQGQQIRLRAEGPDADAALAALRELIEQNFEDR